MQVKSLTSGGAKVVASGEVTTFDGQALELAAGDDARTFVIRWDFIEDLQQPGPNVLSTLTRDSLALTCVNFDNHSGRGSSVPVLCARFGDEYLFLHFRVFRYGRTNDRTLHYTLYLVGRDALSVDLWLPDEHLSDA